MKQHTLSQLIKDQNEKKAVALATDIDIGLQTLVYDNNAIGPDENNEEIQQIARQAMRDDRCKIMRSVGVGFLSKYLIHRSGC